MKRLAAAAALVAACGAFAQDAVTESAARTALAKGEYAKVMEIYRPLTEADERLSDIDHYRIAIAASRLGMSMVAWQHLTQAIELDPNGSFASSPARLAGLRETILAACQAEGRVGCRDPEVAAAESPPSEVAATAAPSAPPQPAPVAATPSSPPAALPDESTRGGAAPVEADVLPPVDEGRTLLTSSLVGEGAGAWPWVAAGLLAGVLGGGIAVPVQRALRRRAAGAAALESLRDSAAHLVVTLERSGAEATPLYRQLQSLLPLIEREVGRTSFHASGDTAKLTEQDEKDVQWARHLTRQPLDALTASPQDVQRLFQRRVI